MTFVIDEIWFHNRITLFYLNEIVPLETLTKAYKSCSTHFQFSEYLFMIIGYPFSFHLYERFEAECYYTSRKLYLNSSLKNWERFFYSLIAFKRMTLLNLCYKGDCEINRNKTEMSWVKNSLIRTRNRDVYEAVLDIFSYYLNEFRWSRMW